MPKHPVLLLCGLAAALPAVAFAGPKVTAGDQSLQISGSVSPSRASAPHGARGVALKLNVDYESLNAATQVKESTKQIVFHLPPGQKIHTDRAEVCKVSDMLKPGPDNQP